MTYRPPFFSERVAGEVHINACTIASSCMTLASWSLGELTPGPASSQATRRRFREDLEPGPDDQSQGFNPLDFDTEMHKRFSNLDLPPIPSWDNPAARLRINFAEWRGRIIAGECGVLQGNVGKVKDPKSPLHRFVNAVGHAIYVESSTDPTMAHVMDPMGLPVDTYDGDRVPWVDLEQFASEFSGAGFMFVSLVPKGAQSRVSLNSQITQLTRSLADTTKQRDTAQKRVREVLADNDTAKATIADLEAQLAAGGDCTQAVTDATAPLQARIDAATAALKPPEVP